MAQALSWVVSDDDEENENGHMEELSHNKDWIKFTLVLP